MTMHIEEIRQHPLWGNLADLHTALAAGLWNDATESLRLDALAFAAKAKSLASRLETEMVGQSALDRANSHLANLAQATRQLSDGNTQYNTSFTQHLDALRKELAGLPREYGNQNSKNALVSAYTAMANDLIEAQGKLGTALKTALSDAEDRERAFREAIETAQSRVQQIDERYSTSEEQLDSRVQARLSELDKRGYEQLESLKAGYAKWLKGEEHAINDMFEAQAELISELVTNAQEQYDAIAARRTQTDELAQLVAGDITADAFATRSKDERKAGRAAYIIGGIAVIAGVVAAATLFGKVDGGITWQVALLKFGITAALGGAAAVAFRFGSQAFTRATSFTRQELELRALTPFLAGVTGASEARVAFANRAFGHAWAREAADTSLDVEQVTKLVEALKPLIPTADSVIKPMTAPPAI